MRVSRSSAHALLAALDALMVRGDRNAALHAADRAIWSTVLTEYRTPNNPDRHGFLARQIEVQPALNNVYGAGLSRMCGRWTVARSWTVEFCGSTVKSFSNCDPGLTSTDLFLDRRGHWLLWAQYAL